MDFEKVRKAERIIHLTQDVENLSDISVSGVCLKTEKPFKVGAIIALALSAKNQTVDLQARVVNSRPSREDGRHLNGVEFVAVSEKTREILAEMIENYGRGIPIKARIAS